MSISPTVTRTAAFAALCIAVTAAAVPRSPGVTATFKMRIRPFQTTAAPAVESSITGTARLANGKGRVDLESATGPAVDFQAGDFLLIVDSAKSAYVRPSTSTYWDVDTPFQNPLLLSAAQAAANLPLTGVSVTMEPLGPSDTVSGLPTKKFRVRATFNFDFGGRPLATTVVSDSWVASLPVRVSSSVLGSAQTLRLAQFKPITERMAAYDREIAAQGTVVYSETTTSFNIGGQILTLFQSMELSDIKAADVDESKMTMPAGFKIGGHHH